MRCKDIYHMRWIITNTGKDAEQFPVVELGNPVNHTEVMQFWQILELCGVTFKNA